jgi:HK97 family phage portal protein
MNWYLPEIIAGVHGWFTEDRATKGGSSGVATPEQDIIDWFGGGTETWAGTRVDEATALTFAAVFACVTILSETVGSLPLILYRRLPNGGKERAIDHPLFPLIHSSPNPEMTGIEFREFQMQSLSLWGNSYNQKIRDRGNRVVELWPLQPAFMKKVAREKGELIYLYQPKSGPERVFTREEIHHIKSLSTDGVVGLSRIALQRQAIGAGLGADELAARYWGQGTHFGGFLEHPGRMGKEAQERLKDQINKDRGLVKSHMVQVLEEGMVFKPIGIPAEDAQFLETRQFNVQEIARIFRVPPHLLADLSKATFSNIEQQSLDFVIHTIRPWIIRIEQAITRDIIPPADKGTLFAEFLVDALLRGDIAARFAAYSIALQNGINNRDEIRALENQNPIPDGSGQMYTVQLNMADLNFIAGEGNLQPEPADASARVVKRAKVGRERLRIRKRFLRLFQDVMRRMVKFETSEVRKSAQKRLGTRSVATFRTWLDKFYAKMPAEIKKRMAGVFETYSKQMAAAAFREAGSDEDWTDGLAETLKEYLDSYTARYVKASLGQLEEILREAEDPLRDTERRLDEWDANKGDSEADGETVRLGEAMALTAFTLASVTKFVWRTTSSDPCPFCQRLNGRTVGVNKFFVKAGENVKSVDDDKKFMKSYGNKRNPPMHDGCDCQVVPE